jgi:probable phosphoglycerate mutase
VRRLLLVRHVPVVPRAALHARTWEPSEEGLRLAGELARAPLFTDAERVAASPEPKARATAGPIAAAAGVPLHVDERLAEVDRGEQELLPPAGYAALASAYLGGVDVGWEPAPVARRRFAAAVAELADGVAGDLVVVAHGLVLALYLALEPAEWEAMPLPAVCVVEDGVRTTFRAVEEL